MMRTNARNVNVTSPCGTPRSLSEIIYFLTRPLIMFYTPNEIMTLQSVLQTTLTTAYFASSDRQGEPCLFLTLSSAYQPPRPILAACIAACVQWADWIMVLGGKEVDVLVEPSRAVIRFGGQDGVIKTIWQEPAAAVVYRPPQLRVSVPCPTGFGSDSGTGSPSLPLPASLRAAVDSATARAQGRTKAQELLEFNDKEEADEIFALISNVTGITPTPTRDRFQLDGGAYTATSPLSPISSPESSRPSSRSSDLSSFSLASSSVESMTTMSSVPCLSFKAPVKPSVCSPPLTSVSPKINNTTDDRAIPELDDDDNNTETRVYVDNTKKTVQKFLYQGGVSTVLTGGVMLGGGPKKPAAARCGGEGRPFAGKLSQSTCFGRQQPCQPVSNGRWRRL
ncbi:hypothetical protein AX17_002168 [Amanita inopinata Kibby_2008]|nr:hypothetical protein AX17_002168 [Amanita inopinata Kibby_2008]